MNCACCHADSTTTRLIQSVERDLCEDCAAEYDDLILAHRTVRLVMVGDITVAGRFAKVAADIGWRLRHRSGALSAAAYWLSN